MKKITSLLSLLLALLMLLSILPLSSFAMEDFYIGQVIEYGSYPSTRVKDSRQIKILNRNFETLTASGDASWTVLSLNNNGGTKNFINYCDIEVEGVKYRAVIMTSYSDYRDSCQENNGYKLNKVYWFKYESLKWTVVNNDGLMVCNTIIDARPFGGDGTNDTLIRWLNNEFVNTAFSSKLLINYSTGEDNTDESIFLYTSNDDDIVEKKCLSTDYAKLMGVKRRVSWFKARRYSNWFTDTGSVYNKKGQLESGITYAGVRPCFMLSTGYTHETPVGGVTSSLTPATTKKAGSYTIHCDYCNEDETYEIPQIGECTATDIVYGTGGKPNVSVRDVNGNPIDENYYTIEYPSQGGVGIYYINVKFSDHYDGTVKIKYAVLPDDVVTKNVSEKENSLVLSWFEQEGADGYVIYTYDDETDEFVKLASTKDTHYEVTDLESATKYTFYIRTYAKDGKEVIYGKNYVKIGGETAATTTVTETETAADTTKADDTANG